MLLVGLLVALEGATAARPPDVDSAPAGPAPRHVITSSSCATPPFPDGSIARSEWDGAATGVVTTTPMTLYVMHDADNLYIALDAAFDEIYHHSYITTSDKVQILVDGNNDLDLQDAVDFSLGEDAFDLLGEGVASSVKTWKLCQAGSIGRGWIAGSDDPGHVQYELEIPLSTAEHVGDVFGLYVRATDRVMPGGGMAMSVYPPGGTIPWWFECDEEETCVSSWAEVRLPFPCADPHEPNDTSDTATPIQRGTAISGFVCDGLDRDTFTFPISPTDGLVTVTLSGAPDALSPLPANYNFTVYRPDGVVWAGTETPGTVAETFTGAADQVGNWHIQVTPNWTGDYNRRVPYYLRVDVGPSFLASADLLLFSPTVLTGTHQFLWARPRDNFGAPVTGLADVEAKIGSSYYAMYDNGVTEGDLAAGDGVYSLSHAPTAPGTQAVELYVSDEKLASNSYAVPASPSADLLVVTDHEALYDEFGQTGTVHGFYELMARIHAYADDHDGIVLDVAQDASGYTTLSYTKSLDDRAAMGVAVDALIHDVGERCASGDQPDYVVVVGSDSVVPFYRLADPKRTEFKYQIGGNPTLSDTLENKMMSDFPYWTWSDTAPKEGDTACGPDMAGGRIFQTSPANLQETIDLYEQAIDVSTAAIDAYPANDWEKKSPRVKKWDPDFLTKRKDSINPNYVVGAEKVLAQLGAQLTTTNTHTRYGDPYTNNGWKVEWDHNDFISDLSSYDLVFALTHGRHTGFETGKPNLSVDHGDITGVTATNTILVNAGCHGGYTVGPPKYYDFQLALGAMRRGHPYLAATTGAYWSHSNIDYPSLSFQGGYWTEQVLINLASQLTQKDTVGEALQSALSSYASHVGKLDKTEYHTIHSWMLYGLPTQRLTHGTAASPGAEGGPGTRRSSTSVQPAAASSTMTMTVDVGAVYTVPLAEGETLVSVFGAQMRVEDGGPSVPQWVVQRSFPAGTGVGDIELTSVNTETVPGTYQPLIVEAMTGDGWIGDRDFVTTTLYPAEPFTWTVHQGVEATELVLLVNPIQWNLANGTVLVRDDFVFSVTYVAPPAPGPVRVVSSDVGQAPYAAGDDIEVSVALDADEAAQAGLTVRLTDGAENLWHEHEQTLNLPAGSRQMGVGVPTDGCPAGAKYVEVLVTEAEGGRLVFAETHAVTLNGLALLAWLDAGAYEADVETADLTARAWDEQGDPVTGADCSAWLDGRPVSVTFAEPAAGAYTATLPLTELGPGAHTLAVRCQDARELEGSAEVHLAYGEPLRVYLPAVLRER